MKVKQPTKRVRNNAAVRKHRYGITQEQYDAMLAEQNYSCAVCLANFTPADKPRIDHDRNCCPTVPTCGNCLRGLLCSDCVTMARYIETRFGIMEDMFRYLRVHLEKRTNAKITGGDR